MKYDFLSGLAVSALLIAAPLSAASAADMAVKAPPAPAAAPVGWTGCYVGFNVGDTWSRSRSYDSVDSVTAAFEGLPWSNPIPGNSAIGGGTVGCDYQTGALVFGVEGDGDVTDLSGSRPLIPPFNTTFTNSVSEAWFATARGRIGYTGGAWLLYATGGAAFAGVEEHAYGATGLGQDQKKTLDGWTAGVGVEYAFMNNLSLKMEYLYADLGHSTFFTPGVNTISSSESTTYRQQLVLVGINLRFH
jgi:outer membrane immunogenic protein